MRELCVLPLGFDEIAIPEHRREADPKIVKALADSIERIGLQHPISVRRHRDQYILVAGLHRLRAVEKLGLPGIMCAIRSFTNTEARMWEISENLHRAELTKLERAEQIEEWRKLSEQEAKGAQVAHPGGKQPHDAGVSKVADALGVTRREVERSRDIASITPEAKEAAIEAGIDDNQSKLLQVAREEPAKQVGAVYKAVQPVRKPESEQHKRPATADGHPAAARSWTVVASAEDGKRYGNGVRLRTKEEARAYMVHAHRPLWECAINEIHIAPSADEPNCQMDRFDKGRDKGKVRPSCRLIFEEGTCGNLAWGEIDADGNFADEQQF
jgi:ParB family chromosome partitioning protein